MRQNANNYWVRQNSDHLKSRKISLLKFKAIAAKTAKYVTGDTFVMEYFICCTLYTMTTHYSAAVNKFSCRTDNGM